MKKEIKLSDGRVATFHEGKGKDLFEAMRLASEPGEITKLLMARLLLIDGKQATEDDIEELPLQDAFQLMQAFTELFPFAQTKKQSSS